MANRDFRRGLVAVRNPNGNAPKIEVLPSVSTVLYEGALLARSATTGLVGLAGTTTLTSTIAKKIVGVVAAGKAAGALVEGSASKVLAYTDPAQEYVIQSDDSTMSTQALLIGKPYFKVVSHLAGNGTTLRSEMELDGNACSSVTTSSVAHVLEVRRIQPILNNALGANVAVIVRIARKFHASGQ